MIIASGPSLADTDLDLARDVPTFAMNRSYLLYDQWGFEPTYYVSINELVLSQFGGEIAALGMPKFVNHASRKALGPSVSDASIHFLRLRMNLRDSFTTDITQPVCSGGTVTFVCLELAHFMGFRSVVLVGLDHRFSEQGTPNSTATRSSDKDLSHAHPEYFPRGTTWQLPDLARSELAYEQARAAFEQVGGRVIDATPGGACPVFEKMGLAQALRSTPRL